MAIAATSMDSSAAPRPVQREQAPSPIISDGHNGGPVEIKGEMSFWDVLDIINPLQHIPIVSTIYRHLTGDTIQPAARVIGDILYGGPLGGMASIANAVIEQAQGKDIGDQIMASLGFEDGVHPTGSEAVAVAAGGPAAGSPADPAIAQTVAAPTVTNGQTAAKTAEAVAAGQPIRLATAPSTTAAPAAAPSGAPSLAAQLSGSFNGAIPHSGKMPARDTPLASSTLVKHSVPKFAAPLPGATPANAQTTQGAPAHLAASAANSNGPAQPDMLSETMMRNLAKYEQSRKAAQSAAPALRVSS